MIKGVAPSGSSTLQRYLVTIPVLDGNQCPFQCGKMEVGGGNKGQGVLEFSLPACKLDCTKQHFSKPDLFPWQLLRLFKDESVGGRGGWVKD